VGLLAFFNGYNYKLLLALFAVYVMQLDEYFAWTYLDNPQMNERISKIISATVFIQPFAMTYLISNPEIRNLYLALLVIYSCVAFWIWAKTDAKFYRTTVAENGHLSWKWMPKYENLIPIYLLFFTAFLAEKEYFIFSVIFVSFLFSLYSYNTSKTFSSMWCWSANIVSAFILFKILFYDNIPRRFK
jgi:hypothetical protein